MQNACGLIAICLIVCDWGFYAGFVSSANVLRPEDNVRYSRFTVLKGMLKTKVYEKVADIKSENPIFLSVMLKSNIGGNSPNLVSHNCYFHVKSYGNRYNISGSLFPVKLRKHKIREV
jgi:hypothetical protein